MEKIKDINFLVQKSNKQRQDKNKAMVLIHGYGANCQDLAPLAPYLDPNGSCDYFFPNGPVSPAMMAGFGFCWFDIRFSEFVDISAKERIEYFSNLRSNDFVDSLEKLRESIELIAKDYDEIILGGFSQGSMMSTHLAQVDKVSKLLIFSGSLIDKTHLSPIKQEIFQAHGLQDPVLDYGAGVHLKQFLEDQNSQVLFTSFAGGHEIPLSIVNSAKNWLNL